MTCLFRGFRVQDILNCIQRKAGAVETCARKLQDEVVVKNYLTTREVQKATATTQVKVDEIYEGVTAMNNAVRGLDSRYQEIDSNIVELKDFISEQISDALASKNGMFQMLKDVVSGMIHRPLAETCRANPK
jgi:methyl-accepting chemotaxis protein